MQLVGAEGQEIHPELAHINLQLAGNLHRIGVDQDPFAAADGGNLGDRKQHAGLIVGVHAGHDRRVGSDRLFQPVDVERAVALHRQIGDVKPAPLEVVAKIHVGGVLHRRGDHVLLARVHHQGTVDRRVVRFRAAAGEHHLLRVGIDQGRHLFPRLFHMAVHLGAERVGARRIAPELG